MRHVKKVLAASAGVATLTLGVVTGCSLGDKGENAGDFGSDPTLPAASSSARPAPTAPSDAPQIGSGTGLADTAYIDVDAKEFPDAKPDDPKWALTAPLEKAFAWKPAVDATQFDAFRRASSGWNNFYLKDNEMKFTTLVPMNNDSWEMWGDQGVEFFPKAHILPDQHPADTDTDRSRVVKIDLNRGVASDDRTHDQTELSLIAAVRVHDAGDGKGWRVDNFHVIDTQAGQR